MLDFNKLIAQIESVGVQALADRASLPTIIMRAEQAYRNACQSANSVTERLKANKSSVLWPVALPIDSFGQKWHLPQWQENATVLAVDGSQIMPNHHEIHQCFLLNIGLVQIAYGSKSPPVLTSFPHLYHKAEDLYPLVDRRRLHIDELYVSLERNLLEFEYLVKHLSSAKQAGQAVVAMVDGSLIPWSLERMPEAYQKRYLAKCTDLMQSFQNERVPLVGYISHSRSADIVNDLRISICPYERSCCAENCGTLNEEDFPCSTIWPLSDAHLLSRVLAKQERSGAYLSGASVTGMFADDFRICFSYLKTQDEIARIEFPQWLLSDQNLFDTALSAVVGQVEKGRGYPIALAEAHHLAVIKGADRQAFFDLLSRQLVSIGAGPVRVSPKEGKKRVGMV